MSTYPGDDPQKPDSEQPVEDIPPDDDASGTEPTQPVGYWERQAAEQAAERAGEGRPDPTTPYPQGGGAVPNPTSAQPPPGYDQGYEHGFQQGSQGQGGENPSGQQNPYPYGPQNPYGPYAQQPYGAPQPSYSPPPGQQAPYPPSPQGAVPYQPPYVGYYSPPAPDQRQSTLSLVLGLVGLIGAFIFCGVPLLVSPFAWVLGSNSLKEIKASQGRLGGETQARTGMILGIIGTVLLILAVVGVILFIVVVAASETTTGSSI